MINLKTETGIIFSPLGKLNESKTSHRWTGRRCGARAVAQSCPTLCDPMDCSPPGSSVHGLLQARTLEWVAMPSSRGSSRPRDRTHVFLVFGIAGGFFTICATKEAHFAQIPLSPFLQDAFCHNSLFPPSLQGNNTNSITTRAQAFPSPTPNENCP